MAHDLDRIADAAVATALADNSQGYALLVQGLDLVQMQKVGVRLANHCATSMIERAEEAGLTREHALAMWQAVIAQQHGTRE